MVLQENKFIFIYSVCVWARACVYCLSIMSLVMFIIKTIRTSRWEWSKTVTPSQQGALCAYFFHMRSLQISRSTAARVRLKTFTSWKTWLAKLKFLMTVVIKHSLFARVLLTAAAEWRKMVKTTVQQCLCAANASWPSVTVWPGQAVMTSRTKSCSNVNDYYVFIAVVCKVLDITCYVLGCYTLPFVSLRSVRFFFI